jgi:hypothetical protein
MTKSIFRTCAILALALMGSQTIALAQNSHSLEGTWDVSVTVTNCQTGAVIRTVRSLQMFSHDGSFTETANTFLRGSSLGTWARTGGQTFNATYWFFRYTPAGGFASIAKALDAVTLNEDGNHFSASGTIQDFDANNNLISIGCFLHSAKRLSAMPQDN